MLLFYNDDDWGGGGVDNFRWWYRNDVMEAHKEIHYMQNLSPSFRIIT